MNDQTLQYQLVDFEDLLKTEELVLQIQICHFQSFIYYSTLSISV